MQAPEWYRTGRGPGATLPAPPQLPGQGQTGAEPEGKSKPPPPPQRPPPVPKGAPPQQQVVGATGAVQALVPALPGAPAAPQGAAQALALPPLPGPLPALAVLPPPPRAGQIEGAAAKVSAAYHGHPSAKAGSRYGQRNDLPQMPAGGGVALALKDDVLAAPGAKALAVKGASEKSGIAEKAFMIPGLQPRPYDEDELKLAFDMINLDKRFNKEEQSFYIGPSDLRRIFELCGEPEPSNAEIDEMIRLHDPDGNGTIDWDEFREAFQDPPILFRNFDLQRREPEPEFDAESSDEDDEDDGSPKHRDSIGSGMSGYSKTTPTTGHDDPRLEAVDTITQGKKFLKPEFIKTVYQRFVELDKEDGDGFISFEVFCLVLRRAETREMRKAFQIFDFDNQGELDLRQFVVGLSMFTSSSIEDKLRFAFMMYDEEQRKMVTRSEMLDLIKAMAPYVPEHDRERHVNRMYAMFNLRADMPVNGDEFMKYVLERADDLVPNTASSTGSQSLGRSGSRSNASSFTRSNMGSRE